MRSTARIVAVLGLLASIGGGGLFQSAAAQSTSPAQKTTFYVGWDSDVTGLNLWNACCGPDYEFLDLVYDLGIGFNPKDLSAAPQLITSWDHSSDYMTWTMKVRDDATWSDGKPVTAADVAFSFNFVAKYKMPFYKDYLPFNPTFSAPNDTTVIWHSTEPTFAPNVPPWIYIIPEHIWSRFENAGNADEVKKAAKEYKNFPLVGSGPFTLAEWQKGQFMRFEANKNYWGGAPHVDEVVFRFYDSQEAMAQALKSGEIDIADGMNPTLFNALKGQPNIGTHVASSGCWGNIAFNFGGQGPQADPDPAIHDLAVRQAVVHAINKQEIVDKVYQGDAQVANSILVPSVNGAWYQDPTTALPADEQLNYDPTLAKQMLAQAGYKDTNGDGILEAPDGHPLDWKVMTITDVQGSVDTGKLLKAWLADIGIGASLVTVNTNKAYDLWGSGSGWDIYVWDWCPDPDPDFMLSVFTTDQCLGWSDGCYSSHKWDKWYAKQQTLFARSDRAALIDKMQQYIYEQAPTVPLEYEPDLQAYRTDRFTGFVKSPDTPNGLLIDAEGGVPTYLNIRPIAGATSGGGAGGISAGVWAIVAGVIVIGGALIIARRRIRPEQDEV